jgi:hypothetical protein
MAGFFIRCRMAGMKRPLKVHWHAYLMLGIGMAFLLLAGAGYYCDTHMEGRRMVLHRSDYGGNAVAMSALIGALLAGIGIYAMRTHKD